MTVIPIDKPVGAEIRGVDLSSEVDDAVFQEIRTALDAYSMVFLRNQVLDEPGHVALSKRLGPLRPRARIRTHLFRAGWI